MYTYKYELVDTKCRLSINLLDHAAEINRAFYFVRFGYCRLKIHRNYFEFAVSSPLQPCDARSMGRHIASTAKMLAQEAIRVYGLKSEQHPASKQSKQLFKRKV